MTALLARPENRPIAIAMGFVLVILALGTAYTLSSQGTAPLLSPNYLLQQLQTGSFLGIVAAGMMMVILLGHIDLSVPWTLAAAAMMATTVGGELAIPTGIAVGVAVGLVNGFGVAFLRIPSMIFTLGVDSVMRGLMVAHTGGFAPRTEATPLMRQLAAGKLLGIPLAIFVWIAVSVVIATILARTGFGRAIYATGTARRPPISPASAPASSSSAPSSPPASAPPSQACCLPAIRPRPTRAWATRSCFPPSPRSSSAAPTSSAAAAATSAPSSASC